MRRNVVTVLLIVLVIPILPAVAASGLTNLQISNSSPKTGETIAVEFDLTRNIEPDRKYQIAVNLSSIRDGFTGIAELSEGDYSNGKWKAKITIPENIYSGDFAISFRPIGKQENNKDQISAGTSRISIYITGKQVPIPPVIEVINIKSDRPVYPGGALIKITFDTKILWGAPNEETSDPIVKLWDLRFNSYLKPTTNRGKPINAVGSYKSGKWALDYPIDPQILSTNAQIIVETPRGYDLPSLVTKGEIIQIQGLVNEIKISNVTLDKPYYEPKSRVKVTFSTSATESILNSSSRPYIVLTDLEQSDLSERIEVTLLAGTLNEGKWIAEFSAPEIDKFTPAGNRYLLGFYNSSGTIRDIGPDLKIRKSQKLVVVQPKTPIVSSTTQEVDIEVISSSGLPVQNTVVTPTICRLNQGKLLFLAQGECEIESIVSGNDEWAESTLKTIFSKVARQRTIVCTKGKLSKKITAANPKCPAGYKKS